MENSPLQPVMTARIEQRAGTIWDGENYKVVVVSLNGKDYTLRLSQQTYDGDVLDIVCEAINKADRAQEASLLVQQAVGDADRIAQAKPVGYADYGTNPRRHHTDTRPYSLKDAKFEARYMATVLRKAWDLLDPPMKPFGDTNGSAN